MVSGPPIPPNYRMHTAKKAGRNQLIFSVHRQNGLWFGVDMHHAQRATSGMHNHALNFLNVLWQRFANQRNLFYIESPPVVTTIVAIKGPISSW
jgi:hypothetical protein